MMLTSAALGGEDAARKAKRSKRDNGSTGGGGGGRGHVPKDANAPRMPRVYRACESCRRKKIKCDGVEPVCGQCMGSINMCTWKPTADRAAHSRQYVQQLESRLHHMETIFQQVAPVVEALTNAPNGFAQPPPPAVAQAARQVMQNMNDAARAAAAAGGAASASAPGQSYSLPAVDVSDEEEEESDEEEDELDSDEQADSGEEVAQKFGQLQIDENGQWRWIGGASTMSLVESFRTLSKQPAHPSPPGEATDVNDLIFPPAIGLGKVRRKALPASEEVEYPARDLADALVSAYFERFHHTLPVLDKPTFLAKYKEHMERGTYRDDAGFQSTIFGVFAVAARFHADPRLGDVAKDGGLAMTFYDRAMILHFIGATKTQLAHVQCVVLLSSFLASWNLLGESWLLLGQGVRTAQDLGLHRAAPKSPLMPLEQEMHKRIWWCVYMLDRLLAIALGRPLGIEDSDCDVDLPLPLDDEALKVYLDGGPMGEQSTSMIGFIALTNLAKIGGQMLRQVYAVNKAGFHLDAAQSAALQASVDQLDADLSKWCDALPADLRSKPKGDREIFMAAVLCTSYYAILISLHRVFLPASRKQGPQASSSSFAKAVSASRNCILLAKALRNIIFPSHHLAFFVQYLFSSAVILCLCIMRLMDENAIKQSVAEVTQCIQCLQDLETLYPGAKKCRELLTKLFDLTKEHSARRADKERHHHLHRAGSSRKTRRPSNKTGSSSPGEWSSKRPHITPPREILPGSQQPIKMSPGQAHAVPQYGQTQQLASSAAYGSTQQAGQHVLQGMAPSGTFSPGSLRPSTMASTSIAAPGFTMQSAPPAAAPSSYHTPPAESSSAHKRTRQESAFENPAGSSYIPTFGPSNQPLRSMHGHVPPPINVRSSSSTSIPQPPNSAPPAAGNEYGLPALPANYMSQATAPAVNPSGLSYSMQPEWSNSPVKRESPAPPSAPNPGSYTPSPPNYQTAFNVGSNGTQAPFDLEGLNLPPGDADFLSNFGGENWGSDWGSDQFDANMSLDLGTFDFGFDPQFPFNLDPAGTLNSNQQQQQQQS